MAQDKQAWGSTLQKVHNKEFFVQKEYTNNKIIPANSTYHAYYKGTLEEGKKTAGCLSRRARRTPQGLGRLFTFSDSALEDENGRYLSATLKENMLENTIISNIETYAVVNEIPTSTNEYVPQSKPKDSETNEWGSILQKIHNKDFFTQNNHINERVINANSEYCAYYKGTLKEGQNAAWALYSKARRTQTDGLGFLFSFGSTPKEKNGNYYIPVIPRQNMRESDIIKTVEEYSLNKKVSPDKRVSQIEPKGSTTNTLVPITPSIPMVSLYSHHSFFQNPHKNNLPIIPAIVPPTVQLSVFPGTVPNKNLLTNLTNNSSATPQTTILEEATPLDFSDEENTEENTSERQAARKVTDFFDHYLIPAVIENNANNKEILPAPSNPSPSTKPNPFV